jgi:hypothetical protein
MQKVIGFIGILALSCFAEQLIWFDSDVTWNTSTGGWSGKGLFANVPNLVVPTDYADHGAAYLRVEVLSKPTDYGMAIQACNWTDGETCSWLGFGFSNAGDIASGQFNIQEWWASHSWSNADATQTMWVLKDPTVNRWVDVGGGWWCMGPSAAEHLPVTVHIWALLTTAGAQIDMPPSWNFPCPEGWPCETATAVVAEKAFSGNANSPIIQQLAHGKALVSAREPGILRIVSLNGALLREFSIKKGRSIVALPGLQQGLVVASWKNSKSMVFGKVALR